jgi:hypothetical protein
MNPVAPAASVPSATSGPAFAGPTAVAPAAPNTNLPPGLANLTAGAILNGSVVGRDAQGHVLVQTPNGMLSLATALTLPQGSTLSLQIQTMGVQIQMVVLSINQQAQPQGAQGVATVIPLPLPQSGAPVARNPTASPAAPPPESPAVTVTMGRVLTATVIEQAAIPGGPAAPGQSALALLGGAPAGVVPGAAQSGAMSHDLQPMLAALLGRQPRDGETAVPQKGTRLMVRIAALDTDPASDPKVVLRAAGDGRGAGRLLLGTVAEPDSGGLVQLNTPLGLLSLSTKIPFPPASRIVLEIVGEPELPGAAPAADAPAMTLAQGRGWPTLEEALSVLARAAPGELHHGMDTAVPRQGPELAQALIAALAAIKTGDVRALVGDHLLKALDLAGHHDLAVRLGAEFQQLSSLVRDPAGGDWRSFLVPVHDGAGVQFVRFFVRRNRKNANAQADPDSTTRFVVEVDLSRMGSVQLDGLVKPKKFDLIIRSRAALDATMRREISRIFTDALAASGHSGALTFQASPHFAPVPSHSGGAPVGLSV